MVARHGILGLLGLLAQLGQLGQLGLLGLLGLLGCEDAPALPDAPASPWSQLMLPGGERRLEPAVTANGTRLVIAGGFETSFAEGLVITDEVLVLDTLRQDTITAGWSTLPSLPVRWHHGALAAVGGTLYLLGGFEGPGGIVRGESFMLPLGANEWIELAPMPAGFERAAAGVAVASGTIYLLGGASASGPVATVLEFDLIDRTWSRLTRTIDGSEVPVDLPTARSHVAGMLADDGSLIVAGGLDAANRALGDVYRLPLGSATWELRAPMTSRGGCAYDVVFGSLVCAGGELASTTSDVVERYDPLTPPGSPSDVWETLPPIPEPRGGTQGAVIGTRLYLPGGSATRLLEPTDSVFVLNLLDTAAAP